MEINNYILTVDGSSELAIYYNFVSFFYGYNIIALSLRMTLN